MILYQQYGADKKAYQYLLLKVTGYSPLTNCKQFKNFLAKATHLYDE